MILILKVHDRPALLYAQFLSPAATLVQLTMPAKSSAGIWRYAGLGNGQCTTNIRP